MNHKGNILYLFKITFLICVLALTKKANAQEVRVIDNKGTIASVNNNNVTSSATAPTNPVENDIWYDTSTTPHVVKIFDGTTWIDLDGHRGTTGSIFFADAVDGAPTEDNDELFWDNSTKRFYVGNNTGGTNKVNITGTIGTTLGINNTDGTEAQPSYRFTDDSDTGIYRPGADQVSLVTGGNDAISIANNQNVTIHELPTGTATDSLVVADTNGLLKKAALNMLVPTIYAAGKVNADGTTDVGAIYNATITKVTTNNPIGTGTGGAEGDYYVDFDTDLTNTNYIIQLSIADCGGDCPGNTTQNYDDPGITYYGQAVGGFYVNIGDSDNGTGQRDDIDLEFMFTVIVLP